MSPRAELFGLRRSSGNSGLSCDVPDVNCNAFVVPSRTLLWVLIAWKTVYVALLLFVLQLAPNFDRKKFNVVNACWPREGGPIFASHFATWDSAHYLYLSEAGYKRHVPSCAFYPLWPLLVRWCALLAGGSHLIAGLVLSNLFSLAAWVLFYQRARRR